MKLIYSRTLPAPEGFARRNPRFFEVPEHGVDHVVVDGDWPEIAEAYQAAGATVERYVDPGGAAPPAFVVETPPSRALSIEERGRVEIPDDWRGLPWVGKPGTATLRALAAPLSDAPVINKAQATAAIESELVRRGMAREAANIEEAQAALDAYPDADE